MKKVISVFALTILSFGFVQKDSFEDTYKAGEYLQYRMHYGFLNAGFASLTILDEKFNGKDHFHVVGKGSSSGVVRAMFKVDDNYETYIDKATGKPSRFVRKIDEGGYTKNLFIDFDNPNKKLTVNDLKNKTVRTFTTEGEIHDLISAFYRLRNYNTSALKAGDFINLDIFMEDELMHFKLKILGREKKDTKYGDINCLKIRPYVSSGRVFKAQESVTMWVTDDQNHVPIQIKAELAVGSLKADLHDYKNLKYPINFK